MEKNDLRNFCFKNMKKCRHLYKEKSKIRNSQKGGQTKSRCSNRFISGHISKSSPSIHNLKSIPRFQSEMRATTTNNFARLNIAIDYGVNAIELDTILGHKTSQVPVKSQSNDQSSFGQTLTVVGYKKESRTHVVRNSAHGGTGHYNFYFGECQIFLARFTKPKISGYKPK